MIRVFIWAFVFGVMNGALIWMRDYLQEQDDPEPIQPKRPPGDDPGDKDSA